MHALPFAPLVSTRQLSSPALCCGAVAADEESLVHSFSHRAVCPAGLVRRSEGMGCCVLEEGAPQHVKSHVVRGFWAIGAGEEWTAIDDGG